MYCAPFPIRAQPPVDKNAPRPASTSDVDPALTVPDGWVRPELSDVGAFAPSEPSAVESVYVVVVLSPSVVNNFNCDPLTPMTELSVGLLGSLHCVVGVVVSGLGSVSCV